MQDSLAAGGATTELFDQYAHKIQQIKAEIAKVVIGQEEMISLMINTLLSKGHILLEGVPGLAKSLAVETFARVIGGNFKRFQFTPDKMPSDITGTMVWNEKDKRFLFIIYLSRMVDIINPFWLSTCQPAIPGVKRPTAYLSI